MFDIGWQELFIIVVVGIIVIGPKELPRAARAIAGFVRKARMMAHEFQDGVDDMIQQADLEDIKKGLGETGADLKNQVKDQIDPDGTITRDLDMTDFDDEEFDEDEEFKPDDIEQIAVQPDSADQKHDAEPKSEPQTAKPQDKGQSGG